MSEPERWESILRLDILDSTEDLEHRRTDLELIRHVPDGKSGSPIHTYGCFLHVHRLFKFGAVSDRRLSHMKFLPRSFLREQPLYCKIQKVIVYQYFIFIADLTLGW